MNEISIKGLSDGATIRFALADALGLAANDVLMSHDYWGLERFEGKAGVDIAPDGPWTLVTLYRSPEPEDDGPAIAHRLAMRLGTPCAVFDTSEALDHPSIAMIIFDPDGSRREGYGADPTGPGERFSVHLADGTEK